MILPIINVIDDFALLPMFADFCGNSWIIKLSLNDQKYAAIGDGKLRIEYHVKIIYKFQTWKKCIKN